MKEKLDIETDKEVVVIKKEKTKVQKILTPIMFIIGVLVFITLLILFLEVLKVKRERDYASTVVGFVTSVGAGRDVAPYIGSRVGSQKGDVYSEMNKNYTIAEGHYYSVQYKEVPEYNFELVDAIRSKVSLKLPRDEKGRALLSKEGTVLVTFIDTDKLIESIYADTEAKDVYNNYLKNTPKEVDTSSSFAIRYLTEKITACTDVKEVPLDYSFVNKTVLDSSIEFDIDYLMFSSDTWGEVYSAVSKTLQGYEKDSKEQYKNLIPDNLMCNAELDAEGVSNYIGDGRYPTPASIGQTVKTNYTKDGSEIFLTVDKVYKGEDAIAYANSVDAKNRGLTSTSDKLLIIVDYTVENLGDTDFEISNDFSIADASENKYSSTGEVFGLQESTICPSNSSCKLQYYCFLEDTEGRNLLWGTKESDYLTVWFDILGEK